MSHRKLGLALAAVPAIGAVVVVNSAFGTATETKGFWNKAGVKLASGTKLAVTCGNTGNFVLESTVGASNTPLKLEASTVTCPGGEIFNESEKAKATGKIKFSGVKVIKPEGKCVVTGGTVETVALKGQVWMEGTTMYERFAPASGETFANVSIEGCSIEEVYPAKGVVFGKSVNATGEEAETQELTFSGAVNTTAGGSLTFGGHAATLAGTGTFKLTGGGRWGASEVPISCIHVEGHVGNFDTEAKCTGTEERFAGSGEWERNFQ
jgi:hypothetical protein